MLTAFSWILFGLVIGAVAKILMPGKDPGRLIGTTVIGMAGGVVGGCLGQQMGIYEEGEAVGWVMAVVGALIVLAVYRWLAA